MKYHFSRNSLNKLRTVHPDLVGIAYRALFMSPHDFGITEGGRSEAKQKQMVEQGKSQTMNSRHLTGHAIDFAIWHEGEWNWDLDKYEQVADCFKEAATEYDVKIVWGGDWTSLKDGPHIQLDWNAYPA